jgi:hypothetical protein
MHQLSKLAVNKITAIPHRLPVLTFLLLRITAQKVTHARHLLLDNKFRLLQLDDAAKVMDVQHLHFKTFTSHMKPVILGLPLPLDAEELQSSNFDNLLLNSDQGMWDLQRQRIRLLHLAQEVLLLFNQRFRSRSTRGGRMLAMCWDKGEMMSGNKLISGVHARQARHSSALHLQ